MGRRRKGTIQTRSKWTNINEDEGDPALCSEVESTWTAEESTGKGTHARPFAIQPEAVLRRGGLHTGQFSLRYAVSQKIHSILVEYKKAWVILSRILSVVAEA